MHIFVCKIGLLSVTHNLLFLMNRMFSLSIESFCTDINGNNVKHGDPFVPEGNDFCLHCKCLGGKAEECFTTGCAKPTCKDYKAVPGKCCAYTCPSG